MMGQQPSTNRKAFSRLLFAFVALALFAIGSSKIDNSRLITFLGFAVALLQWLFPLQPTSLQFPRKIRQQFFQRYWLVIIWTIGAALFTLLASSVYANSVLPIDVAITQEFQKNQTPWLHLTMLTVSYLGSNSLVFAALTLLTAQAFWVVRLRLEAVLIIVLSSVSSLLNILIKVIVSHPRSTAQFVEIIQVASMKSFPSGEVMRYVAYFGLLFSLTLILFKRDRWWQYAILIISGAFVVLIGPSRVYLGEHWASDVLGGYLLGSLLLSGSLTTYLTLKKRIVLTAVLPDVPHLLPCGHERRTPTARFCSVCGAPISS